MPPVDSVSVTRLSAPEYIKGAREMQNDPTIVIFEEPILAHYPTDEIFANCSMAVGKRMKDQMVKVFATTSLHIRNEFADALRAADADQFSDLSQFSFVRGVSAIAEMRDRIVSER